MILIFILHQKGENYEKPEINTRTWQLYQSL